MNKNKIKTIISLLLITLIFSVFGTSLEAYAKEDDLVSEFVNNNSSTDEIVYINYSKDGVKNSISINSDDETYFEWGNSSSLLVWISLMQLEEQGKLDLDKSISEYLSDEFNEAVTIGYPISVTHLMNHNAGFQQNLYEIVVNGSEITKYNGLEELLINNVPKQIYAPGNTVAYSDYGVTLAAYIVECVSGLSYEEYVVQNIFEPLGLEHSLVNGVASENSNLFSPYYPAYMVVTTAPDMNSVICDLCSDNPVLMSASERDKFFSSTLNYHNSEAIRNAHGLFGYELGINVIGLESTSINGHTCNFYIDPVSKDYLLVNSANFRETLFANGAKEAMFGSFEAAESSDLTDYKGLYIASNTITKGKQSFMNLLSSASLSSGADGNLYRGNKTVPYITGVGDGMGIMNDGTVVHIYKDPNYQKRIELPHMELLEFSLLTYYLEIVILILQVFGYVFASGLLLFALFRFLYLLIKKDLGKAPAFRKYMYIQCGNITIMSIFFGLMYILSSAYASYNSINFGALMYWVGSLLSLVYIVFFVRTGKNENASKLEKVLYIVTFVFSFVNVMFAIMFHLIF